VLSWAGSEPPGYPYDEATALLAALWAWRGDRRRCQQLVRPLEERLAVEHWLGRDGIGYVFDTALVLPLLADPAPVAARVMAALSEQRACSPVTRPGWWSQSYGAHLLKCGFWLARVGQRQFAEQLADDLVQRCFDGERFHIHEQAAETYLHSHCYALEGLVGLGVRPDVVAAGARWLAQQQEPDGSLPDWFGCVGRCHPADVCAQAVRLWSIIDAQHFEPQIQRGLACLAVLQHSDGGIRYHRNSENRTSWVAVFALQALTWAAAPPPAEELQWLL